MQAYSIFDSPPKPKKQRYFAGFNIVFPFIAPQNRDQTSPVGWG